MAQLVLEVKARQRNGLQQQWTSFVRSQGCAALDPNRHHPEMLEAFLATCSKPSEKLFGPRLTPCFGNQLSPRSPDSTGSSTVSASSSPSLDKCAKLNRKFDGSDRPNLKIKNARRQDPIQAAIEHAKTIIWTRYDPNGNEKQVDYYGKAIPDKQHLGSPCT